MGELEDTWTENSFYERPLTFWTGTGDAEDIPALDIFTAASIGCCKRVQDILAEDPDAVGARNKGGWSGLMYAAYYGHSDVLAVLLSCQASVHLRNAQGCNTLMLAVMCGNEPIMHDLIKAGSHLEARDHRDWTALFHAVNCGHLGAISVLLSHKANPNSCERMTGLTPLMKAAQLGNTGIVEALLKGGAVTSLASHQGHTAARLAVAAGYKDVAAVIAKWELQGGNGSSLFEVQSMLEARVSQQARPRGNNVPSLDNTSVIPTTLESLLNQLGLTQYMTVFREQDVDLHVFLSLTDQDLKECGIQKLGPRRKMTSAIARWHSNAPLRSTPECAYADKLEVEMQELALKVTETMASLDQTKERMSQERDLRVVTEGWVVEARGRLQECHQRSRLMLDQLAALHHCLSLLSAQFSHIQPSLISTALEALGVASVQRDTIDRLSDPSIPRGPSNPPVLREANNPSSNTKPTSRGSSNPSTPRSNMQPATPRTGAPNTRR